MVKLIINETVTKFLLVGDIFMPEIEYKVIQI